MKKIIPLLGIAACLTFTACQRDPNPQAGLPQQFKNPQDSTTIVTDPTTGYFGDILVKKDKESHDLVKIIDFPQYSALVHLSSGHNMGYVYYIPSFQIGGKRKSFICDESISYVHGAKYNIEYWKFISGQEIDERQFIVGYVQNKYYNDEAFKPFTNDYKPTVYYPKKIDPSVEGIITKIRRIDNE